MGATNGPPWEARISFVSERQVLLLRSSPFLLLVYTLFVFFPLSVSATTRSTCLQTTGTGAIEICRKVLDESGNDLKVMRYLADIYIEREMFDQALQLLDRTRQEYPDARRISYKIKLTKSMQAEKLLFAEDESDGAKASRERQKENNTKDRLNRVLCLKLKGERGLKACEQAINDATTDAALLTAYSNLLESAGQSKKAKAFLARVEKQKVAVQNNAVNNSGSASKTKGKPVAETFSREKKEEKTEPSSTPKSLADTLRQLKSLHDQSLIDDLEYSERKTILMEKAFGSTPARTVKAENRLPKEATIEQYGNYHALVIGVQNYRFLNKLQMAQNDAREVSVLLENEYRYNVILLEDPTRREILLALGKIRRTLKKTDNLLIYYAGHGWLDEEADTGYWMPVNAARDNDIEWLSLNSVISAARAIPAKHIMIVADSCFSGKLTRGLNIKKQTTDHISRMASRKARVVLTSGGLEPVLDGGGGNHSVFAAVFLDILRQNNGILDGTTLFSKLRREVMLRASQTPEYADIRKAGHEGGDFLFIRIASH
ncbi:MAG: caspase family protein [Desulfobacterales bacterium]|nr:caspase family protein [Desulfobacterales bacterium]